MPPLPLEVERPQAEFASWYELFPRSQSGDPQPPRHLRRRDRPPADIREMGFDVLYFPPIHPIGEKNRKGRNNSLTPAPGRSRQPLCDRQRGGRARRDPSAARHARRFPPARRGGARARPGDRARLRDPVLARSSVAARASRLVQAGGPTARSNTPRTRRRNTRTSSTSTSTAAIAPALWAALRDVVLFWAERRRAHLPRRQSAHQAAAVLAMDDRRCARALSRRDLPVRGLHAAEDDVPARQDRLLAVLHLLHLAQHQAGARPTI